MHPAATVWLSEDKARQPATVPHRLHVHRPEPAVARTIWRPRDCIPKAEIHLRPYGTKPHNHPTNRQQAATQWAKATSELLQDRQQSPVRRSTTDAYHTWLSHSSKNSLTSITSTHYMHYIYNIVMQKPKIHQPGEHSWSLLDPTGSTAHGRSLHTSFNAAQSVIHQHHKRLLQFYTITIQHGEIAMTDASMERPS